jgi:DmsE family decaheme c-type cytochrome
MPHGLLLGSLLALFAFTSAPPAAAQQRAQPATVAVPGTGGEQVCLKCHGGDPKVQAVLRSPMGVKGDVRTPMAQLGCQSCHGLSDEHVAGRRPYPDIVFQGPNASPVAARNQVCLGCHLNGERISWAGSTHQRNDIACTNCHTAHVVRDPLLDKRSQPFRCFTCHLQQQAQTNYFSHHPIREGLVTCSDCHNPHGGHGPELLREVTINQTCYNCHGEKRGPFLREHPPVRENCANCHLPHGSTQPRLLVERPPYLCQNCHDGTFHPGAPYSSQSLVGKSAIINGVNTITTKYQMIGQSCLNCHSAIHGSNSPGGAVFLR